MGRPQTKKYCIGCMGEFVLTRHHVFPIGTTLNRHEILHLCKRCHRILHNTFTNEELFQMGAKRQVSFLRGIAERKAKLARIEFEGI